MNVGVIVGIPDYTTSEQADQMLADLRERFPGVTFALVPGATSIWFPLSANDGSGTP